MKLILKGSILSNKLIIDALVPCIDALTLRMWLKVSDKILAKEEYKYDITKY